MQRTRAGNPQPARDSANDSLEYLMLDLTDSRFGRWTVIRPDGRDGSNKVLWLCRCDCGATGHVTTGNLRRQISRQCRRCADTNADHGSPRQARPKLPRTCSCCGVEFRPKRTTAKYCSERCKNRTRWVWIAADSEKKASHARRVTGQHKLRTYIQHDACEYCGRPFVAPPTRRHCSRECLDKVIASGKYRSAFHRRRVEREFLALATELEHRLENKGPNDV